tara:strand:- start:287 stop:520 length:234 start_codon:yes stop_codon:yes gene_type:complete
MLNNQIILTQIEEVGADIGEPDCKITEPFVVNGDLTLTPWLVDITNSNEFMIHSDKILTITEPSGTLVDKYNDLVKE